MPSQLHDLSATELLAGYAGRSLSPVDVMQAVLDRIAARNGDVNALAFLDCEAALKEARESEARWVRGGPMGPLDGIPMTLKDSIAESRRPMLRGLKANIGAPSVGYDSPPAARVKEAGAIIFAKTTMSDFAAGTGVSSAYGVTRNPWNLACNTSGSSSGGAAAVAAGFGPLSVGTDAGGSVRVPAAYCGLIGLKPTQGRVPHLPAQTYRTPGPLTRTVRDSALLLNVMAQPERLDFHSLPADGVDYVAQLKPARPERKKIAFSMERSGRAAAEPAVRHAVERAARMFSDAGAEVDEFPVLTDDAFADCMHIMFLNHFQLEYGRLDAAQRAAMSPKFAELFASASNVTGSDALIAGAKVEQVKADLTRLFAPYDYLLSPVTISSGFPAESLNPDGIRHAAYLTSIWNQTGHPALSICCGFDDANGMPIGLQIVGQRFDDLGLLRMATTYEQMRGFSMPWPQ